MTLDEGFRLFSNDLDKLQQFVEVNQTAFSKILKKVRWLVAIFVRVIEADLFCSGTKLPRYLRLCTADAVKSHADNSCSRGRRRFTFPGPSKFNPVSTAM